MGAQLVGSDSSSNRLASTIKVTVLPGPPHTAETRGVELLLGERAAQGTLGLCLRDSCADKDSAGAKGNVCFWHGVALPRGARIEVICRTLRPTSC
jgi:hypothetical protein